jgi:hypothetical protein
MNFERCEKWEICGLVESRATREIFKTKDMECGVGEIRDIMCKSIVM